MAQRAKNILIPQAYPIQRIPKQIDQTKTYFQSKFFITPNRQTTPLGLPLYKQHSDLSFDQRFLPSFDNFSLSALFTNKILNQTQLFEFKKDKLVSTDIYQTPARKKLQNLAYKDTEQASRHFPSQTKKSRPREKGLRQLSQRAYEIVLTLRSASYKEVANKLVDQLNHQKQVDHQIFRSRIEQKDEQNIKRRVYDALNVLIALGVLRKEGRKIVGDRSIKLRFQEEDKKCLQLEINSKLQKLKQKKDDLKKAQSKLIFLPKLIEDNKRSLQQSRKIDFPFLVLNGEQFDFKSKHFDQSGNLAKFSLRNSKCDTMRMDLDFYSEYQLHHKQAKKS